MFEKTYFIEEACMGDLALNMDDVIATIPLDKFRLVKDEDMPVEEPRNAVPEEEFSLFDENLARKARVLSRRKADAKAKLYARGKNAMPFCERKKKRREDPDARFEIAPKLENQYRREWRLYNGRPQMPKSTARMDARLRASEIVLEDAQMETDMAAFDPDDNAERFRQELKDVGCYHPAYYPVVEVWLDGMPVRLQVGN